MITSLYPDFSENRTIEERVQAAIEGYAQLRRELEYGLQNIDMDNMTASYRSRFQELTGGMASLTISTQELGLSIEDAQKNIASLKITANGLQSSVKSINGSISTINQWADFIETRVGSQDGSVKGSINSTITQHAELISLKVSSSDFNGNNIISKINLSSTTAVISAQRINLEGYVTISSLSTAGATTINGANIQTGTIRADSIEANSITTDKLSFAPVTADSLGAFGSTVIDGSRITSGVIEGIVIRSRNPALGNYIEMDGQEIACRNMYGWRHGPSISALYEIPELRFFINDSCYFSLCYNSYDGKVHLDAFAPLKIYAQQGLSLEAGDNIWFDSNVRLNSGIGIYDVNNVKLLG